MDEVLRIGLDAGGSHCRAWLFNAEEKVISKAVSGPANVASNIELATKNFKLTAANALREAGLNADLYLGKLDVGAGVAGVHSPSACKRLAEWDHPFNSFAFDTDLYTAHIGAHAGQDGATIICGTGFSALAVIDSQRSEVGGYGFPAGDKACGASIGLEALQAVFLAADGLAEKGALWERIVERSDFDVHELAGSLLNMPAVEYARFALDVFHAADDGDMRSAQILKRAANYLDKIIQLFVAQGAERICVVGSVGKALIDWLPHRTQVKVVPPKQGAEWGALQLISLKADVV